MSVIPPLDRITKAPALGVDKIQQQFNKILDSIADQAKKQLKIRQNFQLTLTVMILELKT